MATCEQCGGSGKVTVVVLKRISRFFRLNDRKHIGGDDVGNETKVITCPLCRGSGKQ